MKKLTVKELLWITSGVFHGNPCVLEQTIENHAYMLRELKIGGAYYIYQDDAETAMVSLRSAHKKGAIICLTDKEVTEKNAGSVIKVNNMQEATRAIGRYMRQYVNIPIVAVTGSVGKTSTKDMLVSVLAQKYKVTKTSPYWNSNYRIAFCILNIDKSDEVIVIESAVGNMTDNIENGQIIRPDFVVMTNIGESHMDSLKTRDNILEAKRKLLDFMSPTGYVFINYSDDYLRKVQVLPPKTIVKVGYDDSSNIYATDIVDNGLDGSNCIINGESEKVSIGISVPGVHFVESAMFAYGIGKKFNLTADEISLGIKLFETSDHRCKVIDGHGVTILDDCYNISPKSTKSALDIIGNCNSRRCVVLGAMNRLGESSERFHREIARYMHKKIDLLIAIGGDTKFLLDELKLLGYTGQTHYLDHKEDIQPLIPKVFKKGDYILVKGALPDHFSDIVDMIREYSFE